MGGKIFPKNIQPNNFEKVINFDMIRIEKNTKK